MGNLCGKEDPQPDPPGRVLGSATSHPSAPSSSSVPAKVGGPPRKLGSSSSSTHQHQNQNPQLDDARQRAADAAEARAKTKSHGGKLQRQLSAQKRQSRSNVLKQASEQDRRARDAHDATSARNWD